MSHKVNNHIGKSTNNVSKQISKSQRLDYKPWCSHYCFNLRVSYQRVGIRSSINDTGAQHLCKTMTQNNTHKLTTTDNFLMRNG